MIKAIIIIIVFLIINSLHLKLTIKTNHTINDTNVTITCKKPNKKIILIITTTTTTTIIIIIIIMIMTTIVAIKTVLMIKSISPRHRHHYVFGKQSV